MQSYFFKLQHCNTTYIRVTNLYTVKKAVAQWLESQSVLYYGSQNLIWSPAY